MYTGPSASWDESSWRCYDHTVFRPSESLVSAELPYESGATSPAALLWLEELESGDLIDMIPEAKQVLDDWLAEEVQARLKALVEREDPP